MSDAPIADSPKHRTSETTAAGMEAVKEAVAAATVVEEEERVALDRSAEAEEESKAAEEEEGDACDYDRLFANRFSADDKDFQEFLGRPAELPPVVFNWRPRGARNDRRFDRRYGDGRRGEGSDGGWGRHGDGGRGSYHRDDRFHPYHRGNPHPYR